MLVRSKITHVLGRQKELSSRYDCCLFNITLDELVHLDEDIPKEVSIEDKTTVKQIKLIQELDQKEKSMVFKMIETFLTKKKIKYVFKKNFAAL